MEEFELNLDASDYDEAIYDYDIEFKNLLLNLYSCYILLKISTKKLPNNENKLRDKLLEILKDTKVRQKDCLIEGYRFEKEVDECEGRVDIKIVDINDFENFEAYYIVECKRLDGNKSLNSAYIKDGIERFITSYKSSKCSPYYSSFYGVNGMIGFIVKKIDIDKNMKNIGSFFDTIEIDKLYSSTHDNLKLYHLMMDFSNNLIKKKIDKNKNL